MKREFKYGGASKEQGGGGGGRRGLRFNEGMKKRFQTIKVQEVHPDSSFASLDRVLASILPKRRREEDVGGDV